jgi:DNA-binding transcriptional regulator GbsR (MarR family)
MHLHDRLHNILTWSAPDLTAVEAADLLGLSRWTISASLKQGQMEGSVVRGKGRGNKQHYRIGKAALIKWMWDNTVGDRTMMRAELAKHAPEVLEVLEAQPVVESKGKRRTGPARVEVWHPAQLALFEE